MSRQYGYVTWQKGVYACGRCALRLVYVRKGDDKGRYRCHRCLNTFKVVKAPKHPTPSMFKEGGHSG